MGTEYLGTIYALLIVGALVAWPLSLALLKSYRTNVLRLMSAHSGTYQRDSTKAPAAGSAGPAELRMEFDSPGSPREPAAPEFARALQGPGRTASIYAVSGVSFAAIMAGANVVAAGDFVVMQWLVLLCIYAWPVVLAANLLLTPTQRVRLLTFGIYFFTCFLVFLVAAMRSPGVSVIALFVSWGILNLPPTLLFLLFLNRRVRAVGPMVFAFALISLVGAIFALSVLDVASAATDSAAVHGFFAIAAALGMSAAAIFALFALLGLALFAVLGWFAIRRTTKRYVAKKLSDQSLTIDSLWLLFGSTQAVGLAFTHPAWILASLVGFGAFKAVSNAGFARATGGRQPIRADILFLRVFSLGERSERSFDVLSRAWRYIGNVRMIAGPDLATATVEPHEFLNHLCGKIGNDFVADEQALQRKLADLDVEPDFDGRFRVSDFFCYDDTWRSVLVSLVQGADAVFMDLRGFSAENAGATFEINELVNSVPLSKVTFAIDASTDQAYLERVIRSAWSSMNPDSPNRSAADNALRIVRLRRGTVDELSALTMRLIAGLSPRHV